MNEVKNVNATPKYVKRLIEEIETLLFCHEPAYAADNHIDRVYIMRYEPIHCLVMVRESGEEFWDLTHSSRHTDWNKHIDQVKDGFLFWSKNNVKAIASFCYGWKHTIYEYSGDLDAAIENTLLLIESFRR